MDARSAATVEVDARELDGRAEWKGIGHANSR